MFLSYCPEMIYNCLTFDFDLNFYSRPEIFDLRNCGLQRRIVGWGLVGYKGEDIMTLVMMVLMMIMMILV